MGTLPGAVYNELIGASQHLTTIHQVKLAPRTTCIAVKNCSKSSVCSIRSSIKLSTLLDASLPCVPFLFTISGAGNNTSVKT